MGKVSTDAKNVEEYLASVPEQAQTALAKLRQTIRSIVPDAAEGISYNIVVFKHNGRQLVGIGATRNHCALYLMSTTIIPAFKDKLESYEASGGTIRFPAEKPLPSTLVKTLVKARIAENEKAAKRK